MKWFYLIILLIVPNAFASYTNCPAQVTSLSNYSRAWKFLKSLPTQFQWGACSVEIHICDIGEKSADDDIIGDLWIKNQRGREQYLTFIFPESNSTEIDAGVNWLRYHFRDNNYDETHGKFERVSLAMSMKNSGKTPARLLLYNYTSNEHDVALGIFPIAFGSLCYQ